MLPREQFQFQGNNSGRLLQQTEDDGRKHSFFVWVFISLGIAKTEEQAKQMLVVILLLAVAISIVFLVLNIQPKNPQFVTQDGKVLDLDQVINLKKQQGKPL